MSCPELERVAAWCLGELTEAEGQSFEEHYFSCDGCLEQAARMFGLLEQLRASLPPVLTAARRQALEAAQPRLQAVRVRAGERATLHMSAAAPVGVWLLQARLEHVTQVNLEARTADGALQFRLTDVPFDPSRGEVALACQLHYRALPGSAEMLARLTAEDASGARLLGEYTLDHQFEVP